MRLSFDLILVVVGPSIFVAARKDIQNVRKKVKRSLESVEWKQFGNNIEGGSYDQNIAMNSSGNRIITGGHTVNEDAWTAKIRFVKIFDSTTDGWKQVGNTIVSDTSSEKHYHEFGWSVAISAIGNRVLVGDPSYGLDRGRAMVFDLIDDSWIQIGRVLNGDEYSRFSQSLAMNNSGSRIVFGLSGIGELQVFDFVDDDWKQVGENIKGDIWYDKFGISVAINGAGTRIVSGAVRNGSGNVRAFDLINDDWKLVGSVINGDTGGFFGYSVAMNDSGNRIVAGLLGAGQKNEGFVKVYDFVTDDWLQVGDNIYGNQNMTGFGRSVAINKSGSRIASGATQKIKDERNANGYIRVFDHDNGNWEQVGDDIVGENVVNAFGNTVDMNSVGDMIIGGSLTKTNYYHGVSGYIRTFSSGESITVTNSPTTIFQGLNFSIGHPEVTFVENKGNFTLLFDYSVGPSAASLDFSLFGKNCTIPVSSEDMVQVDTKSDSDDRPYSKTVEIDRTKMVGSPFVTTDSNGYSKGTISFCARGEALDTAGISVTFLDTDINISYDLTQNSFEVTNNVIKSNAIAETTTSVTSKYAVSAFRCNSTSFDRDEAPNNLDQNSFVFICIKPENNTVEISNYMMIFEQNNKEQFRAVKYGIGGPEEATSLSSITKDGDTYKTTSRLITRLFEETSFIVSGNAYLKFKNARRKLLDVPNLMVRSAEDFIEGDATVENSAFMMDVKLKKSGTITSEKSSNNVAVTVFVLVGVVIVTIGLVILKKMRK